MIGSMKIFSFVLLVITLSGCATSGNFNESGIGSMTVSEFDQLAIDKSYGRWHYREYYGYQIIGWNKRFALPYYAIFDENDVLVEYIGTSATKHPDPDDFRVLRAARVTKTKAEIDKLNDRLEELEREKNIAKKIIICPNASVCKKAFSLAQIFISENAQMKIQLATDTIIETYGSQDKVAMKATKIPGEGESETINLLVICC